MQQSATFKNSANNHDRTNSLYPESNLDLEPLNSGLRDGSDPLAGNDKDILTKTPSTKSDY